MGRIHAWLRCNVVSAHRIRCMVKIMLDYSGSRVRNRGIDLAIREFYELERMILAVNIRNGIRAGVFRQTNVERLAALISVHLDGVIVASSIRANFDMDAAIGDIKGLLVRYLGAGRRAMKSTSTRAPRASAVTPMQVRAGSRSGAK